MNIRRFFRGTLLLACLVPAGAVPALAQGYFIPPSGGGGGGAVSGGRPAPSRAPQSVPAPRPQVPAAAPINPIAPPPQPQQEPEPPPLQVQLPPVPDLQPLARGTAPPAAVIGVLGIPDIMRASAAAQQIEKVVGERREKLNADAQKEQAAWREMQQSLANQRAGMTPDQIRAKERELQDRITNAQKTFRDRNRMIQETGQYGLAQIERILIAVIRQVSESRGMNLVLHRAQVALNVNEFDITEQVTAQLNKVLPTVLLPPDGVSPSSFVPPGATAPAATGGTGAAPAAATAPAGAAAPAPAPAPAPATPAPAQRR